MDHEFSLLEDAITLIEASEPLFPWGDDADELLLHHDQNLVKKTSDPFDGDSPVLSSLFVEPIPSQFTVGFPSLEFQFPRTTGDARQHCAAAHEDAGQESIARAAQSRALVST
ncbi:hypothetical protein PINS_up012519 [Pythium insidiosum]|nr:hypothetical protein PINS_up012519 [Pythium insidiosum]